MPEDAGGLAYGLGFVVATALLHAVGIGIGYAIGRAGERHGDLVVRASGGVASVAGLGILTGIL